MKKPKTFKPKSLPKPKSGGKAPAAPRGIEPLAASRPSKVKRK